ncbi:MAG: type II toxin-antitoxin system RelE/ParE family toxin, partial [Deltaproteobacteria bacterium]|nr:type II toxin-antitoxin system RelE/ParE family toxin [Deltaproteobacteria bacterium]
GLRKFRIGDFRVIFSIIGDTALVLRIRHRKEAYR